MHPIPPGTCRTYHCPAKVNVALSIGAALEPGGLHPIASWMVAVDYTDTLSITVTDRGPSRFDLSYETDNQEQASIAWPLETDLTYRAHALFEQHTGRDLPIDLSLRKRIPTGAGLGGGSSDAAYVLVGLNDLFELDVDNHELRSLAYRLGSDVAFLVGVATGHPSAIVTGTGETIEPTALVHPIHMTLIFPKISCPTGEVYGAFDTLAGQADAAASTDVTRVQSLATRSALEPSVPFNDLAEAALTVRPNLRQTLHKVQQAVGVPVHVTGSGSTLFVVGRSRADCLGYAEAIRSKTGERTAVVRSLPAAVGSATAH